uniref:Uncharacterized protein n=1 Tax=Fagus sylvatica TaxID=28930 RepID=A0A2N9IJ96_FAGSY
MSERPFILHTLTLMGLDGIQRVWEAKKLEANIEMTRKEIEDPTEVEIELKRRLGQMTDHLIQKQAQPFAKEEPNLAETPFELRGMGAIKVEALSSEKATLLFRIEAVLRLLDENKSMLADSSSTSSRDLESGTWEFLRIKSRRPFASRRDLSASRRGPLCLTPLAPLPRAGDPSASRRLPRLPHAGDSLPLVPVPSPIQIATGAVSYPDRNQRSPHWTRGSPPLPLAPRRLPSTPLPPISLSLFLSLSH